MKVTQLVKRLESGRIQREMESFNKCVKRDTEIKDALEEIIDEIGLTLMLKILAEVCTKKCEKAKNILDKSKWNAAELILRRIVIKLADIGREKI